MFTLSLEPHGLPPKAAGTAPRRLHVLLANLDSHRAATALSLMLAMFSLIMSYYLIENAHGPLITGRFELPPCMYALAARRGTSLFAAPKVG